MNQKLATSGLRALCGSPQCFQWPAEAFRKNPQIPPVHITANVNGEGN